MKYRLLEAFASLFQGKRYLHRKSNLGDFVAVHLYEDLFALNRSPKFVSRVTQGVAGVNTQNLAVGKPARRGDGTFGELIPGLAATVVPNFLVPRGKIASIEIGAESKILAKAMIKQIDRVINDLNTQVEHFRESNRHAICVAIVGVNQSELYRSFEGSRHFTTDGRRYKHPVQEYADAVERLNQRSRPNFDEFILLPFKATNMKPFPFDWINRSKTETEYAASLVRISRAYEERV